MHPCINCGHLASFHFVALRNNAALSTCVQALCGHRFSFLWDVHPGVGSLCDLVTVFNLPTRRGVWK